MSSAPVSITKLELCLNLSGEDGKICRLNLRSDGGGVALALRDATSEENEDVVDLTAGAEESVNESVDASVVDLVEDAVVEIKKEKPTETINLEGLSSSEEDRSFDEACAKIRAAVASKKTKTTNKDESFDESVSEDEAKDRFLATPAKKPAAKKPAPKPKARPNTRRSARNQRARAVDTSVEFEEEHAMSQEWFTKKPAEKSDEGSDFYDSD